MLDLKIKLFLWIKTCVVGFVCKQDCTFWIFRVAFRKCVSTWTRQLCRKAYEFPQQFSYAINTKSFLRWRRRFQSQYYLYTLLYIILNSLCIFHEKKPWKPWKTHYTPFIFQLGLRPRVNKTMLQISVTLESTSITFCTTQPESACGTVRGEARQLFVSLRVDAGEVRNNSNFFNDQKIFLYFINENKGTFVNTRNLCCPLSLFYHYTIRAGQPNLPQNLIIQRDFLKY